MLAFGGRVASATSHRPQGWLAVTTVARTEPGEQRPAKHVAAVAGRFGSGRATPADRQLPGGMLVGPRAGKAVSRILLYGEPWAVSRIGLYRGGRHGHGIS